MEPGFRSLIFLPFLFLTPSPLRWTLSFNLSSETTGTAIFDHTETGAKTGIASRSLRPNLGVVDPLNTETCPT